jgi:hypothetical protein
MAGAAGAFVDIGLVAACSIAVLGHARWFRPPRPPAFIGFADGHWLVPGGGYRLLEAARGSTLGPWWIRLVLSAPTGGVRILLIRDQLTASEWRLLRLALGRGD